ncbi:uncharacterized protein [Rutidosis leptorrhynchoides]|uniref:uncharacterized protein n=1 Tax=Rutidosis leptorrhynchoides TaxID=125765 RepID=UPI003A99F57E
MATPHREIPHSEHQSECQDIEELGSKLDMLLAESEAKIEAELVAHRIAQIQALDKLFAQSRALTQALSKQALDQAQQKAQSDAEAEAEAALERKNITVNMSTFFAACGVMYVSRLGFSEDLPFLVKLMTFLFDCGVFSLFCICWDIVVSEKTFFDGIKSGFHKLKKDRLSKKGMTAEVGYRLVDDQV